MTTGPQLKGRPPLRSASRLEKLSALDSWTTEPAATQAQALSQVPAVVEAPRAVEPVLPPAVQQPAPVQAFAGAGRGAELQSAPVRHIPLTPLGRTEAPKQVVATQMVSLKLPVDLYHDLKLVAGSIPGESMVSIVCRALRPEVDALMAHLGYKKES